MQNEVAQALRHLGTTGDKLLSPGLDSKLSREFWDVGYFHKGRAWWSICYRVLHGTDEKLRNPPDDTVTLAVHFILGPLDVFQFVVRLLIFPLVWLYALVQRRLSVFRSIGFDCPICHNPTHEPLVYCQRCGQVQGVVRPRITELFVHRCARCGKSQWRTIGPYRKRQIGLVCRDTLNTAGCHRPNRLQDASGVPLTHIAIGGTRVRSKHATIARLVSAAKSGVSARQHCAVFGNDKWKISQLEELICDKLLWQSFRKDTSTVETVGQTYTFARSLVIRTRIGSGWRTRTHNLLLCHNIAMPWIESEEELFRNGYSLVVSRVWMFVVDIEDLLKQDSEETPASAEILSRMVRVVQNYEQMSPGELIRHRIAVLLPVPDSLNKLLDSAGLPTDQEWTAKRISAMIEQRAPAFFKILSTLFRSRNVAYFGGQISTTDSKSQPQWIMDALDWAG